MKSQTDHDIEMCGRELTVYPPKSEPPVRFSEFVSWRIIDTPCRPRRWKLVADSVRDDNSWTNYFQSYEQAVAEWNKRMARDNGAPANNQAHRQPPDETAGA